MPRKPRFVALWTPVIILRKCWTFVFYLLHDTAHSQFQITLPMFSTVKPNLVLFVFHLLLSLAYALPSREEAAIGRLPLEIPILPATGDSKPSETAPKILLPIRSSLPTKTDIYLDDRAPIYNFDSPTWQSDCIIAVVSLCNQVDRAVESLDSGRWLWSSNANCLVGALLPRSQTNWLRIGQCEETFHEMYDMLGSDSKRRTRASINLEEAPGDALFEGSRSEASKGTPVNGRWPSYLLTQFSVDA